jgi:hypothetical protein
MSRSELWGPPEEDEAVARLLDLAKDDWTDIGALVGKVRRRIGVDAPLSDKALAVGELAGVLIDHDVLPGDLGSDPDFQPWPGTRQERVDRIVREIIELGRTPWPAEIAWFSYVPRSAEPAIGG